MSLFDVCVRRDESCRNLVCSLPSDWTDYCREVCNQHPGTTNEYQGPGRCWCLWNEDTLCFKPNLRNLLDPPDQLLDTLERQSVSIKGQKVKHNLIHIYLAFIDILKVDDICQLFF